MARGGRRVGATAEGKDYAGNGEHVSEAASQQVRALSSCFPTQGAQNALLDGAPGESAAVWTRPFREGRGKDGATCPKYGSTARLLQALALREAFDLMS